MTSEGRVQPDKPFHNLTDYHDLEGEPVPTFAGRTLSLCENCGCTAAEHHEQPDPRLGTHYCAGDRGACFCRRFAPLLMTPARVPSRAQGGTGEHVVVHPGGRIDVAGPEAG